MLSEADLRGALMLRAVTSAISLLIIDDDLGGLELLSKALAQPGLDILTTSDPEDGLAILCNRRPKIVLTELAMPRMSGMELLERILEIDPATHVILMTADYSTETVVEALQKGASDYLNKPVSIGPLRRRIGQLLEEARKRNVPCSSKMGFEIVRRSRESSAAVRTCAKCYCASSARRHTIARRLSPVKPAPGRI